MFSPILYSCEAWGNFNSIADSILTIERKVIKSCIGVKQGTSNDTLYIELHNGDIKSAIIVVSVFNENTLLCNIAEGCGRSRYSTTKIEINSLW